MYWEIKKIFKCRTGIIVVALFVLLCSAMFFSKPILETENAYRNDKQELIVDNRPAKEIANEKFNKKLKQMEQSANAYKTDKATNKIGEVARDNLKFMKYKEYKDVSFYKVFNYRASHTLMSVIILVILILIFANIYTDEKISGVDNIILSSKNKFKTLYSKLALAVILPIVIYGTYLGIEFLITIIQYGMPVNGGLEAFRMIDIGNILNKTYTINDYLTLKIVTMLVIFIGISVFSTFFSFVSNNSLTSISGSLIFIMFGKIFGIIKMLPSWLLSILNSSNYVDMTFYPNKFIGIYLGNIDVFGKSVEITSISNFIFISNILIGLILCTVVFKKFLTR